VSRETVAESPSGENRFTTFDEQRGRESRPKTTKTTDLARVAGLVVGLAALLGFGVWGLSPPSADALYDQIAAAAHDGDLRDVTPEIEQFLATHADDPRFGEVNDWLLDIQSQYLFSRLRIRAKRETLTEVQQAYVEAMKLVDSKPQIARDQFAEILSKFADAPDEADPITCVQAAEHQAQRLTARSL
jgi:hypothetical protein